MGVFHTPYQLITDMSTNYENNKQGNLNNYSQVLSVSGLNTYIKRLSDRCIQV